MRETNVFNRGDVVQLTDGVRHKNYSGRVGVVNFAGKTTGLVTVVFAGGDCYGAYAENVIFLRHGSAPRWQVFKHSHECGSDSGPDFTTKSAAVKSARQYHRDGWEYTAVLDHWTKTAYVVTGNPFTHVFNDSISVVRI